MHPGVSRLQTFLAAVRVWLHVLNFLEVRTSCLRCHEVLPKPDFLLPHLRNLPHLLSGTRRSRDFSWSPNFSVFSSFLCVLCVKNLRGVEQGFNTEDAEKRGEHRENQSGRKEFPHHLGHSRRRFEPLT